MTTISADATISAGTIWSSAIEGAECSCADGHGNDNTLGVLGLFRVRDDFDIHDDIGVRDSFDIRDDLGVHDLYFGNRGYRSGAGTACCAAQAATSDHSKPKSPIICPSIFQGSPADNF